MFAISTKTVYVCSDCGYQTMKWVGRCLNCEAWNTVNELDVDVSKKTKNASLKKKTPVKLHGIEAGKSDRIVTGINEFNRVMGGGIVKDSVTIVSAKPGAGKSTLLMQVADDIALQGLKVLYVSGEESESQIKARADRLFNRINNNIWVLSDTSMDNVLTSIQELDADLIIIDSIQTFVLEDFPGSRAGSPLQTMECAYNLVRVAKNPERARAVIMVGQMNKSDEIAGLRALEHLVDTVLIIEGENEEELRELSVLKNRFGSTWERGFFFMSERGMESIDNPSQFFMTRREKDDLVSGNALAVVKEGSRPIIAEIESLVSKTFLPYPSRVGDCLRREQLSTLISIIEQRGKISLFDKDIVLKTTGGLKFKEPAVNLAVMMSIISSFLNKPIPNNVVFIADVGLTGELKKVPSVEMRIKEVDRMGFRKAYIAEGVVERSINTNAVKIVELKGLQDVIRDLF